MRLILAAMLVLSACSGPTFSSTYQTTDLGSGYTFVGSTDMFLMPSVTMPGDGGSGYWDPGYATLYDPNGKSLGSMRVQFRGMVYTPELDGDRVFMPLLGEWDVAKRTCYYWDEDGNTKLPCL